MAGGAVELRTRGLHDGRTVLALPRDTQRQPAVNVIAAEQLARLQAEVALQVRAAAALAVESFPEWREHLMCGSRSIQSKPSGMFP